MKEISYKEYYNRVLGSWTGRVAGDFVGIPVELKSYEVIKNKYGEIRNYPEAINLDHVNDDEMYEIIALIALEKYGVDITAKDFRLTIGSPAINSGANVSLEMDYAGNTVPFGNSIDIGAIEFVRLPPKPLRIKSRFEW